MNGNINADEAREAAEDTIERAAAEDTDPLTLLETEDALSKIPDSEPIRPGDDAIDGSR
jgi:hypothetical protein